MPGIFVTGTDTGVGKTLVSAALILWARRRGLDVGGMKPAESGCEEGADGALVPRDATFLLRAAGGEDPLERVCPHRLRAPLAPGIASREEGVPISIGKIEASFDELLGAHPDGVVVEGAGGLLVPMDASLRTVADLIVRLSLPALVVARAGLGTLNHTGLTLEALRSRGIECRGVVLNATREEDAGAAEANARSIEELFEVPVLWIVPFTEDGSPWERIERAARSLEVPFSGRKLDPVRLLS